MKKEILGKKGITHATHHHCYNYLYASVLEAMDEYHEKKLQELAAQYPNDQSLGEEVRKIANNL